MYLDPEVDQYVDVLPVSDCMLEYNGHGLTFCPGFTIALCPVLRGIVFRPLVTHWPRYAVGWWMDDHILIAFHCVLYCLTFFRLLLWCGGLVVTFCMMVVEQQWRTCGKQRNIIIASWTCCWQVSAFRGPQWGTMDDPQPRMKPGWGIHATNCISQSIKHLLAVIGSQMIIIVCGGLLEKSKQSPTMFNATKGQVDHAHDQLFPFQHCTYWIIQNTHSLHYLQGIQMRQMRKASSFKA